MSWLVAVALVLLLASSCFFILVGSLGLVKLSEFFKRLHGPTKASTLGVGCVLLASVGYHWLSETDPQPRELLVTAFLLGTGPAYFAAARRGQGDMVAGHVIGSSLFNLLAIVGGMAVLQPLALPASFVRFELPAVLVLTLLVYPLLRSGRRISQQEGGILCLAFLAWVVLELLLFL